MSSVAHVGDDRLSTGSFGDHRRPGSDSGWRLVTNQPWPTALEWAQLELLLLSLEVACV